MVCTESLRSNTSVEGLQLLAGYLCDDRNYSKSVVVLVWDRPNVAG